MQNNLIGTYLFILTLLLLQLFEFMLLSNTQKTGIQQVGKMVFPALTSNLQGQRFPEMLDVVS